MAALLRLSVWVAAFAAAIGDQSTACSPDAPLTVVAAAVSGHESEESLVSAGGCEVADDEEACLCAALSLKWAAVLRSGLRKRLLSKQPAARVRAEVVAVTSLHPGPRATMGRCPCAAF